jgi:hypothetical protein
MRLAGYQTALPRSGLPRFRTGLSCASNRRFHQISLESRWSPNRGQGSEVVTHGPLGRARFVTDKSGEVSPALPPGCQSGAVLPRGPSSQSPLHYGVLQGRFSRAEALVNVDLMSCQIIKDQSPLGALVGAPGRSRTYDELIKSQLLYQLSYWGISVGVEGVEPPTVRLKAHCSGH